MVRLWKSQGIIDFGLADRTNAVHDLATAIERNVVEWLRIAEPEAHLVHLDHLDALLAGYEELSPLSYEEARALARCYRWCIASSRFQRRITF